MYYPYVGRTEQSMYDDLLPKFLLYNMGVLKCTSRCMLACSKVTCIVRAIQNRVGLPGKFGWHTFWVSSNITYSGVLKAARLFCVQQGCVSISADLSTDNACLARPDHRRFKAAAAKKQVSSVRCKLYHLYVCLCTAVNKLRNATVEGMSLYYCTSLTASSAVRLLV